MLTGSLNCVNCGSLQNNNVNVCSKCGKYPWLKETPFIITEENTMNLNETNAVNLTGKPVKEQKDSSMDKLKEAADFASDNGCLLVLDPKGIYVTYNRGRAHIDKFVSFEMMESARINILHQVIEDCVASVESSDHG